MRLRLVAIPIFVVAAFGRAGAQCSPAVQRLVDDLKYDEARSAAQAAIAQNGANDAALHCMGTIYMAMGKPADAAGWFEKAIRANDKVSLHHLWLGDALGAQAPHTNRFKLPFLARRIKSEFDTAVQLDSTSVGARHGLIEFYSQAPAVMGGSMEQAKQQAREIGRINPMRGHLEMAALLERDKDLAGAEHELDAAVAAAPDSALAAYTLAALYQSEGRWPDAFAVYDRLINNMPNEIMARFQYGRAAAISAINTDRGEAELKRFIAGATDSVPAVTRSGAHMRLGTIYEREGKRDAARDEYRQALAINPGNTEAKKALAALK